MRSSLYAMRISVNGQTRDLPDGTTLGALLSLLGLGEKPVAIEKNKQVVPRAIHTATAIADGDEIEIVHFVGGG